MKKLFVFFLAIFLFSNVLAVNIEVKENVKTGENLIIKIEGNFYKPLMKSNIKFYREGVPTSFGIYDFLEVEGKHFLYVKIPQEKLAGNYTLKLEGVEYYIGLETSQENIEQKFRILEGSAQFSLEPAILNYSESQEVIVQNLMPDKIKIYSGYLANKEDILENSIFNYSNSTNKNSSQIFNDFWNIFSNEEEVEENVTLAIQEYPENLDYIELLAGEKTPIKINIENKLGFQKVWFNSGQENYYAYVWVQDLIKQEVEIEQNETIIEINITVEQNETKKEPIINTEKDLGLKSCKDFGYEICNKTSICSGETQNGLDGVCCLETCRVKSQSSIGKSIGWLMIIALIIFLTWFFQQKMNKRKKTPINLIKESGQQEKDFDIRKTRRR